MALAMDETDDFKLGFELPSTGSAGSDKTLKLAVVAALSTPALQTVATLSSADFERQLKPPNRTSLTAGDLTVARMDWYSTYEDTHNEFRRVGRITLAELRAL